MPPGKSAAFFLIVLINALASQAQLGDVYAFQKDDSLVKKTYHDRAVLKKDILLKAAGKENVREYKGIYDDHFDEIGKLWQSDRVVTAPAAHGYLQTVAQTIIAANPELKNTEPRIVFSRDWWPNAYSMGEGSIVINAGLMVFLDNEAELVFVLCHELAHYYLDHTAKAVRKYVETVNSDTFQKELKRLSKTTYGVNRQLEALTKSFAFGTRKHSRDNEAAADQLAFTFMKKTGYDCQAIKTGLELLDKVDDSLLFKPLELPVLFNFTGYPFKNKWVQKESSIFSQISESDSPLSTEEKDSLKTHPDCRKRIELLMDSIEMMAGAGQKFLVDEKMFHQLKREFFVEMTEQCFRDKNLGRNLYFSLLLMQSEQYLPVAAYSVARCLNQLYDLQKEHRLGKAIDAEHKSLSQEYNSLLRMLNRLRLEEMASLNYHFCKKYEALLQGYPGFEQELNKAHRHIKQ